MSDMRAQVNLPYTSGLPEDVAVNTWHFITTDPWSALTLAAIETELIAFYQAIDGGLLSSLLATTAEIRWYDLDDPEPRAPVRETPFTIAPSATTTAPEVALCMSFQAAVQSGVPQASRRGRVYIGPLAGGIPVTSTGRPSGTTTDLLRDAGAALLLASDSAGGWAWAVFSRTLNTMFEVDNGWVDNEFDIQRRRGREATSRDVF